jgi:polysaccharide deacetylase 2 family uncharacterized protein YibQ
LGNVSTFLWGFFVDHKENILAFGNPGSGKTHLLCAIGQELIQKGRKVYFTPCSLLVQELLRAKKELELSRFLKKLSRYDALIIDDIGHSRSLADQFVNLQATLTFSVLPHLAYSRQLAKELHHQGYEVMLHQPMEPLNDCCDPGPGAVFVGDNAKQIKSIIQSNISEIPFAKGVNNHMGSRFTASSNEIAAALKVIRSSNLYFIDSITSNRSLAHATAKQYQIPTAYRNVFLDNVREESTILVRLNQLRNHALRYGRAIGIGHPFPETARAIGRFAEQQKSTSIKLVPASHIL